MQRPVKERQTITVKVNNYAHILIEQQEGREKYNMGAAYMGYTGYALKQVIKLKNQ